METNQKDPKTKDSRRLYYGVIGAMEVTFLLVGPVVVSLFIGFWLDNTLHTSPLFIILGVIIGFIGSVYNVFKVMKLIEKL